MDGASLPVLAAPQTLTATGTAASGFAPGADTRDSFAAILGATGLTGLSADQQPALTDLRSAASGALRPAAHALGNELPQAAIRGLLGALGIVLDPQALAMMAATPPTGGTAETQLASAPDEGADLAATLRGLLLQAKGVANAPALGPDAAVSALAEYAQALPASAPDGVAQLAATLLAMLLPANAAPGAQEAGVDAAASAGTEPAQDPHANAADGRADLAAALLAMLLPAEPAPGARASLATASEAGSGRPGSSDGLRFGLALPLGSPIPAMETAATGAPASAGEEWPVVLDALWAAARHAAGARGGADAAQPPATAAAAGSAAQSQGGELPVPTALLAAVESVAGDAGADAPPITELARGLATALDAVSAGAGRFGHAGASEIVPPRAAALVSDAVSVPVGERGWERAFGERVLWLVGQHVQSAEVRLNPPHLGPVEVRLSLTGQDANVSFTVTHGATRDAIEQAIPRLRELFAEHQLQIVNVDVGQRGSSSNASQGDRSAQGGTPSAGGGVSPAEPGVEPVIVRRGELPGLVDEYV